MSPSISFADEILQAKFDHVQSAIVRVVRADELEQNVGTGVIITSDGHVIIRNTTTPRVRPLLPGDAVTICLSDGRKLNGTTLGWSEEWQIALLRIDGEDRWPHVERASGDSTTAESPCLAASYIQDGVRISPKPIMTTGSVACVSKGSWFTTTCVLPGFFAVFDLQGRLMGITVRRPLEHDAVATHVAVLDALWKDLAAAHNVDQVRATSLPISAKEIPGIDGRAEVENTPHVDATQIATRATVRLRPRRASGLVGDGGWSGVIISESGVIATCGHHGYLPGAQVNVSLSDGRVVRGEILGANQVTDIGLVKISEGGTWPFAKLGFSRDVSTNDPCFVSGFPSQSRDLQPVISETKVVEPDGYHWSCTMHTFASYEMKPGMSGGGVFSSRGELIAIHQGKNQGEVGRHARAEFICLQWDALTSGETVECSDHIDVWKNKKNVP